MRLRHLLFVSVVALMALSSSAAPPAPKLVDRILEAYGGETAWKKAAAIRQTGTVASAMHGDGKLVREWVSPANLRISIDYAESREERVVTGLTGSRNGVPVEGQQLVAMLLQCSRIALPSLLIGHRPLLQRLEPRQRNGRTFEVIAVPLGPEMSIELEADPASGRILRSIGRARVPNVPQPLEFIAVYDDFRMTQGRLFAFHEENYASGFRTGTTKLDRIEVVEAAAANRH